MKLSQTLEITSYEYNDFLAGYVVSFADDREINLQFDREENRLHADFGTFSLRACRDTRDNFSDEEIELIERFASKNAEMRAACDDFDLDAYLDFMSA